MSFFDRIFSPKQNDSVQDTSVLRMEDIYYPEEYTPQAADVKHIELTEKEAVRLGWSFRKKSKHIRITNYHGGETDVTVPAMIGGRRVNELGSGCFQKTNVTSVEMPDTIVKIGSDLFNRSTIRRIVFSDNIRVIPAGLCQNSFLLEEVHLPLLLHVIGDGAFTACRKLKHIKLPNHITFGHSGKEIFYQSGIERFSFNAKEYFNYYFDNDRFRDGSWFQSTPMRSKYKLVALPIKEPDTICVLMVGIRANVKFPKGSSVVMCRNSVNNDCMLDFSDCSSVSFKSNVYMNDLYDCQTYVWGYRGYSCNAVINRNQEQLSFPDFVNVKYPDGSVRNNTLKFEKDDDKSVLLVSSVNNTIMPLGLHTGEKSIKLVTSGDQKGFIIKFIINRFAIDEKNLRRIDLGKFYATDEIFSPSCHELHDVCGYMVGGCRVYHIEKHIPPSSLIGKGYRGRILHRELMKAFKDVYGDFYHQSVIDDIFCKGYVKGRYETIRLNQRDKILIAIDILRGDEIPGRGENRTLYKKYLNGHRRYAGMVCRNIYSDYPEYGDFIADFFKVADSNFPHKNLF